MAYGVGANETGELTGSGAHRSELRPLVGLPTGVRATDVVAQTNDHEGFSIVLGSDGVAYGTGFNLDGQLTGQRDSEASQPSRRTAARSTCPPYLRECRLFLGHRFRRSGLRRWILGPRRPRLPTPPRLDGCAPRRDLGVRMVRPRRQRRGLSPAMEFTRNHAAFHPLESCRDRDADDPGNESCRRDPHRHLWSMAATTDNRPAPVARGRPTDLGRDIHALHGPTSRPLPASHRQGHRRQAGDDRRNGPGIAGPRDAGTAGARRRARSLRTGHGAG